MAVSFAKVMARIDRAKTDLTQALTELDRVTLPSAYVMGQLRSAADICESAHKFLAETELKLNSSKPPA